MRSLADRRDGDNGNSELWAACTEWCSYLEVGHWCTVPVLHAIESVLSSDVEPVSIVARGELISEGAFLRSSVLGAGGVFFYRIHRLPSTHECLGCL